MDELTCQCGGRYFVEMHKYHATSGEQVASDRRTVQCVSCQASYVFSGNAWVWHAPAWKHI